MIRASLLRLPLAGGLCLLSLAVYSPGGDNAPGGLVFLAGAAWGTIELFVLSALLFTYGPSGIIHATSGRSTSTTSPRQPSQRDFMTTLSTGQSPVGSDEVKRMADWDLGYWPAWIVWPQTAAGG